MRKQTETETKPATAPEQLNRKQRKAAEQQDRRRMLSVANSAKAEEEGSEPEDAENKIAETKPQEVGIIGLNGDLALSMMSKNQRKKQIQLLNQ